MSSTSCQSAPAAPSVQECDPLRRIDFTCEEAGRELVSIAAAQRRLLLPPRVPEVQGLDLAVAYRPARQAGGDFYDFLPLSGGKLGIFIADVTGHGAAAALVAAIVHGMVRSCPDATSPAHLLGFVNDRLTEAGRDWSGLFVTAFYAVYDPATRTLAYANAGHPPPRLLPHDGVQPSALDAAEGFPLGIEPVQRFTTGTAPLRRGDLLYLYTDGVIEISNAQEVWFGLTGLDASARQGRGAADAAVSLIMRNVKAFEGDSAPADDQTVVVARFE